MTKYTTPPKTLIKKSKVKWMLAPEYKEGVKRVRVSIKVKIAKEGTKKISFKLALTKISSDVNNFKPSAKG